MLRFFFLFFVIFMFSFTSFVFADSEQLAIVNKSNNKLTFFDQGKLIKTFDVASGRKDSYTPEGSFKIVNKIKNRPYYKEGIPGGDPRNPLGNRWLGIDARGTYGTTYGIHGNNNENSIGKYVSAGCIRMNNDDIEWLFNQIEKQTPVIILHSERTPEMIALQNGYLLKSQHSIFVNGKEQNYNTGVVEQNGRILVPIRGIFETLGASVQWDGKNQTVTALKGDVNIYLKVNSTKSLVNGKTVEIDVPAQIINQRTLVPLRFISEAINAYVQYEAETKSVFVEANKKQPF